MPMAGAARLQPAAMSVGLGVQLHRMHMYAWSHRPYLTCDTGCRPTHMHDMYSYMCSIWAYQMNPCCATL
jgi:hypothetical protein